eukprot:1196380-Prorocentrum_minimum.AAC.6
MFLLRVLTSNFALKAWSGNGALPCRFIFSLELSSIGMIDLVNSSVREMLREERSEMKTVEGLNEFLSSVGIQMLVNWIPCCWSRCPVSGLKSSTVLGWSSCPV